MKPFRLAIDLGTNSLGWALYGLEDFGEYSEPVELLDCGVRIFTDGRADKSKTSLKADRRATRLAGRRRNRFVQRQNLVLNTLIDMGLMPADKTERESLASKDPWEIRKRALDETVSPFEMGRALFHLNQRRGFESNRLTQDGETGVVRQSINKLKADLEDANCRTIGEFLADRLARGESVRARRHGKTQDDLYEFYPNREMLKEEFNQLWQAQQLFNPTFYTDEKKERLFDVIFHQRKLKPQIPGLCQYFYKEGEHRAAKALPSFQQFRIYQELANLHWIDRDGEPTKITACHGLRDAFAKELLKKKQLSFSAMRNIMKKMNIVDYNVRFNLEG